MGRYKVFFSIKMLCFIFLTKCTTVEIVNCKSALLLTLVNKSDMLVNIKFVMPKKLWAGDSILEASPDTIIFSDEIIYMDSGDVKSTQIDYEFRGEDKCRLSTRFRNNLYLLVQSWDEEHLFKVDTLYPWDEKDINKEFCNECISKNYDTLVID